MFHNAISLVIVGFLWGATNPFIRRGSVGVDKVEANTAVKQFFHELYYLATRWQYLVPFLLNQCGSFLYIVTLQNAELSLAVPIANSLSFLFTAVSAILLGEQRSSLKTYLGMVLVMTGTAICMYDKNAKLVT